MLKEPRARAKKSWSCGQLVWIELTCLSGLPERARKADAWDYWICDSRRQVSKGHPVWNPYYVPRWFHWLVVFFRYPILSFDTVTFGYVSCGKFVFFRCLPSGSIARNVHCIPVYVLSALPFSPLDAHHDRLVSQSLLGDWYCVARYGSYSQHL